MCDTPRYETSRKVTLVGVVLNCFLAAIKIVFGFVGKSHALIADGIHSLSDLITDGMVLYAAKASSHGPDDDHPYGHARFETAMTLMLAAFLVAVGLGIFWEAIAHMISQHFVRPNGWLVITVAVISIISKEWMYRYTFSVGKKIKSNLLIANAWHHRSDAFSSIVVLVGVIGTLMGLHFFDALAAAIVAILIIKMAAKMAWGAMRELVDTGIDEADKKQIIDVIRETPGVVAVHQLRSRSMAGRVFVDVHIQVPSNISVSEGHYIGEQVEKNVRAARDDLQDLTIHIDPENDEAEKPSADLPSRLELIALLDQYWGELPGYVSRKNLRLNYLSGEVSVEIILSAESVGGDSLKTISQCYQQVANQIEYIGDVQVFLHSGDES